ncbi:glycosyltransferase [Candidatus Peribacteria bacterium]|nr:glycosyltransferase [Candidatus Peribacteria bacterium]
MKLLMISGDRSLASGKAGAFSETIAELCKHFERIDILCPRVQATQQVRVLHGNVFVHPSSFGLWYQPLWILKKGRELFQAHHHDIMTVHDYPPFYNGIGARLLKRSIGIPAILEIHHIVGWPEASSISETIGRLMTKFFIGRHSRKFDAVRVVNATVKATLASWGVVNEKISVVPSVYLDHAMIESVKNQEKKFDLVFAARLTDNKGLLPLLGSLVLMSGKTLLVIGDGPMRKKAELLATSLRVSTRVTFVGWLPTARDVLAGISSGRIFVMNSKSEGNPRVAIEAMALGVPVLATRVGIMPDVIEDGVNGVFTDGTAKDIAAKASVLLSDLGKLEAMGREAEKISGRFEKTAAIKTYADFLKSLAL